MGIWYKPCRQLPLTSDDDIPRLTAIEEEEPNSMLTSIATTIPETSRSEAYNPPVSILTNARICAETQTPRIKHTSFKVNGICNQGTNTTDSLTDHLNEHAGEREDRDTVVEVWRTAESSSTTPSLAMENINMETSFITINV